MDETRFNATVREAKRTAGAEGVSAILYHVYKGDDNKPHLILTPLSKRTVMIFIPSRISIRG